MQIRALDGDDEVRDERDAAAGSGDGPCRWDPAKNGQVRRRPAGCGGGDEAPTAARCSSGVRTAMAGLLLLLNHERENQVRRGRERGGAARREGGRRSLAAGGGGRRRGRHKVGDGRELLSLARDEGNEAGLGQEKESRGGAGQGRSSRGGMASGSREVTAGSCGKDGRGTRGVVAAAILGPVRNKDVQNVGMERYMRIGKECHCKT